MTPASEHRAAADGCPGVNPPPASAQIGPLIAELAAAALQQLRASATSPADEMRAAIVAAELDGAEAGIRALDAINFEQNASLQGDADTLRKIWENPNVDDARLHPDQRRELWDRHGWFGRLALTWGLPQTNALRRDAIAPARRTTITLLSAIVLGLMLLLAGVVLAIVLMVLAAIGNIRRAYAPPVQPAGAFVEAFAIYLAAFMLLSAASAMISNPVMARAARIAAMCAPIAALWPLVRGVSAPDWRAGLGWQLGRGLFREIGAGIVGYIACLPLLVIGIVITFFIVRKTGAQPSHPIINEISSDPWKTLRILLLASVYAPIVEETMFRGALYHHLRRWWHWTLAAILVAFIFAAIHPQGWAAVPVLMMLAIAFAILREWRGSIIAPVTAHAINNGVVLLFATLAMG